MQGRQAVGRRTVEARSPSAKKETVVVIGVAVLVLAAGLVLAPGPTRGPEALPSGELLPYQRLFSTLPPEDQLRYRELLEGVMEAESLRAESGAWPTVETLITAGIPPFVPNPILKGTLTWAQRGQAPVYNYLGQPNGAGVAWLVLLQESGDRLGKEVPTVADLDEQHHLLSNGEIIHFSVWRRDSASTDDELIILPMTEGWTQILVAPEGPKKEGNT